jgi:hypothetical protein
MTDPDREYLERVEAQLTALTEAGAHRRVRARVARVPLGMLGLAAPVLAAVVVLVVALTSLHAGGSGASGGSAGGHPVNPSSPLSARPHAHRASPRRGVRSKPYPVAPAAPAGGAVPAGFGPESFTALSELQWWLLGTAPCSKPPCTSIVRTSDGGRTFVGIPAPETTQVSQLRFGTQLDAFAYDPQLWVSHTGSVTELATSGGFVYAIVRSPNGAGWLERSPVDSDAWVKLPGAGDALDGLWAEGANVLVEAGSNNGQGPPELVVSHDSGATFASDPGPSGIVVCQYEGQPGPVVWAHCPTGMLSGVWRSTDDGATFNRVGGTGASSLPELPNSAAFGAATANIAVTGYNQLYVTTDGGAGWSPVSGPKGITWWTYIGFTDPTHGVALGYVGPQTAADARLYYTTDGGLSYHLVPIQGT